GWFSVVLVLGFALLLIPTFGLKGVALAKLSNVVPLVVAAICVRTKVLPDQPYSRLVSYFFAILLPFAIAAAAIALWGNRPFVGFPTVIFTGMISVSMALMTAAAVTKSGRIWGSHEHY